MMTIADSAQVHVPCIGAIPALTKSPVLIHIGAPKTATTALQDLFVLQKHCVSVAKPTYQDRDLYAVLRWAIRADTTHPLPSASVLQRAGCFLQSSENGRTLILSDEGLSSSRAADRRVILHRIKRLFPDASLLYTIRNQFDALESAYFYFGRSNVRLDRPPSFNQWLYDSFRQIGYPTILNYGELVAAAEAEFGREKLIVVPIESFGRDLRRFVHLMQKKGWPLEWPSGRFSPEPNRRPSRLYASLQERFAGRAALAMANAAIYALGRLHVVPNVAFENTRLGNALRNRGPAATVQWSSAERAMVCRLYAESNGWLSRSYELGLDGLGYPVQSSTERVIGQADWPDAMENLYDVPVRPPRSAAGTDK